METGWKEMGKRMPYRVPEGFFEQQQEVLTARTVGSRKRRYGWWLGAVAAAACLAVGVFVRNATGEATSGEGVLYAYSEQMGDEELSSWVEFYEADIFLSCNE